MIAGGRKRCKGMSIMGRYNDEAPVVREILEEEKDCEGREARE